MTGMSLLRPCITQGLRYAHITRKPNQSLLLKQFKLQTQARSGSGLPIVPSRYEWTRFKDDLHFYVMLGLVPMFALIFYANVFVGPAELSDIPEGYEPKEWEYHQSPIKRWFAKYFYEEPQKEYERTLHFLHLEREKRYHTLLENKVRCLMQDRLDYKGWYWVDVDKSVVDWERKERERGAKGTGTS